MLVKGIRYGNIKEVSPESLEVKTCRVVLK